MCSSPGLSTCQVLHAHSLPKSPTCLCYTSPSKRCCKCSLSDWCRHHSCISLTAPNSFRQGWNNWRGKEEDSLFKQKQCCQNHTVPQGFQNLSADEELRKKITIKNNNNSTILNRYPARAVTRFRFYHMPINKASCLKYCQWYHLLVISQWFGLR